MASSSSSSALPTYFSRAQLLALSSSSSAAPAAKLDSDGLILGKVVTQMPEHMCIHTLPTELPKRYRDTFIPRFQNMTTLKEQEMSVVGLIGDERADLVAVMVTGPPGTLYKDIPMLFHLQLQANLNVPPTIYNFDFLTFPRQLRTWGEVTFRTEFGDYEEYTEAQRLVYESGSSENQRPSIDDALRMMLRYIKYGHLQAKPLHLVGKEPGPDSQKYGLIEVEEYLRAHKHLLNVVAKPPTNFEDYIGWQFMRHGQTVVDEFNSASDRILPGVALQLYESSWEVIAGKLKHAYQEYPKSMTREEKELKGWKAAAHKLKKAFKGKKTME